MYTTLSVRIHLNRRTPHAFRPALAALFRTGPGCLWGQRSGAVEGKNKDSREQRGFVLSPKSHPPKRSWSTRQKRSQSPVSPTEPPVSHGSWVGTATCASELGGLGESGCRSSLPAAPRRGLCPQAGEPGGDLSRVLASRISSVVPAGGEFPPSEQFAFNSI